MLLCHDRLTDQVDDDSKNTKKGKEQKNKNKNNITIQPII